MFWRLCKKIEKWDEDLQCQAQKSASIIIFFFIHFSTSASNEILPKVSQQILQFRVSKAQIQNAKKNKWLETHFRFLSDFQC